MPFGNMDSDKIEARKGLLETFLKVGGKPFCSALVLFVGLLLHFWWLLSVSTFSATVQHPWNSQQWGDAGISRSQYRCQDRLCQETFHCVTHRQGDYFILTRVSDTWVFVLSLLRRSADMKKWPALVSACDASWQLLLGFGARLIQLICVYSCRLWWTPSSTPWRRRFLAQSLRAPQRIMRLRWMEAK